MQNKWSLKKAAMLGALLSPAMLALQYAMGNAEASGGPAHILGVFLGGAFAGAVMFALAAMLRNAVSR
jgi:Zn-dependent protease with chaperone function